MLKNMGVHGKDEDYHQAIREYEGHPFSLSLLGGYLSVAQQAMITRKLVTRLAENPCP